MRLLMSCTQNTLTRRMHGIVGQASVSVMQNVEHLHAHQNATENSTSGHIIHRVPHVPALCVTP